MAFMTSPVTMRGVVAAALAALGVLSPAPGDAGGFLGVRGGKLLDGAGNPVVLRGFNVEFKDFKETLGEADVRAIAATGANSIRLNLDHRDLEAAPFVHREEGLALLDTVLDWCEKHGLLVVLDLHLAPGRQNPHDFVVHRERTFHFWEDSQFQERFFSLWEALAGRCAGRGVVAGYDLLNEGMPPTLEDYRRVMNAAAARIRARDANHVLVVEEAILPDGTKELVLIEDRNVLYSIHFFHPPAFSFYATTGERPITTYPGEMVAAGERIAETRSAPVPGAAEWREVRVAAAPPAGAEILEVRLASGGNGGTVWFDDVTLEVDGAPVDLPAPLVENGSFETDYPGFNWQTEGSCGGAAPGSARTGRRAFAFSDCLAPAAARSSPLPVGRGRHTLAAWQRSENATGTAYLSLAWHRRRVVATVDKASLRRRFDYALAFRERHGVPLHVGEFTAHRNPSPASSGRYLQDVLEIMESSGLHWSFWEYYSVYPGVGIHTGAPPRVVNETAFEVLRGALGQGRR